MTGPKSIDRHLVFSLGSEEYSVSLLSIKEVIEIPDITPLPHVPPYYLGIMNLRGQVISIIDLNHKLKGKQQEQGKKNAVIILDFAEFCLGILVQSVNRVMSIANDEVRDRPMMETTENLDYIQGVVHRDKKMVMLLDAHKALNVPEPEKSNGITFDL